MIFVDVIEFNHNEIPDNYCECHEHMLEALRAKKKEKVYVANIVVQSKKQRKYCPYCGSTYEKKDNSCLIHVLYLSKILVL